MTTAQAIEEGRNADQTGRILEFTAVGKSIKEWGCIGTLHGEFRTPHAMAWDSRGRLWVADGGKRSRSTPSLARYTSPMPPFPREERISWLPRRVPAVSVEGTSDF